MRNGFVFTLVLLTANVVWAVGDGVSETETEQGVNESLVPRGFTSIDPILERSQFPHNATFNVGTVYPIGFSREGHFAYFQRDVNWGSGSSPDLNVVDLKTDRNVLLMSFRSETVANLVEKKKQEIILFLDRYDIEYRPGEIELERFPLVVGENRYEAFLERSKVLGKVWEFCAIRPIRFKLVIRDKNSKETVLTEIDACQKHEVYLERVVGFIRSPYEDLFVVIVSGRRYAQRDQYDVSLYFYGVKFTSKTASTAPEQKEE